MVEWNTICFDIAVLISGLFLLEYGADKFVDHTAKLALRLEISPTLVALLTAGAEWEEVRHSSTSGLRAHSYLLTANSSMQLAVVIASLSQHRSSLAVGNVLGSTISNILGAFSLGLLFQTGYVTYDASSKIYTGILFMVTSAVAALAAAGLLNRFVGGALIAMFVIYTSSVCCWIYMGVLAVPEDLDGDGSDGEDPDAEEEAGRTDGPRNEVRHGQITSNEESSLLQPAVGPIDQSQLTPARAQHSLAFHVAQIILGFLSVSLSGYIISHAMASFSDTLHLSGTVLGLTILSLATTLPEKFVAVLSGARGQGGILVANTAGSNVFLLTLCLGIVLLSSNGAFDQDSINTFELAVIWTSSAVLALIVLLGSRRWMGVIMILLYIAFIILELTVYQR